MTVRRALLAATGVVFVLGVVLLIVPHLELDLLDVSKDGDIEVFMRRYGIQFLVLTLVFGFASRWPAGRQRRDILVAGLFAASAFTVSTVVATVGGTFNAQGWGMAALEFALAVWFGFLVFTGAE